MREIFWEQVAPPQEIITTFCHFSKKKRFSHVQKVEVAVQETLCYFPNLLWFIFNETVAEFAGSETAPWRDID